MACFRQKLNLSFTLIFRQRQVLIKKMPLIFQKNGRALNLHTITESSLNNLYADKKNLEIDHKPEPSAAEEKTFRSVDEVSKNLVIFQLQSWKDLEKFLIDHTNLTITELLAVTSKIKELDTLSSNTGSLIKEKENFLKSNSFLQLFQTIEKYLTFFNHKELYIIFQFISMYNMQPDSILFKKTVKLLLSNINNIDPLSILQIYKILVLSKINHKYIRYLKLACLEYMSFCFDEKRIPGEPIKSIVYFSSKKYIPLHIRKKLLDDALLYFLGANQTSPKLLANIALALCDSDVIKYFKETDNPFKYFIKLLIFSIDETWPWQLVESSFKSYCWLLRAKKVVYDPEFCDKITLIAISNKYPVGTLISLQKNMLMIPHLSHSLLTKIIKETFGTEGGLEQLNQEDICTLINSLGITDCSSICDLNFNFFRNKLQSLLQSCVLPEISPQKYLPLALNSAVLGIYDYNLINNASNFINSIVKEVDSTTAYVVVLNENNEAIDLSSYKSISCLANQHINIEDIKLAADHSFLVILEFPPRFKLHFKNVDRLLGFGALYTRVLKAMGCNVVTLNSSKFSELLEIERIPYVINEVERVCGRIKRSVSNNS